MDNVRILELLASKICHDLISPVGAVSNGVEILEEMGADAGDDVISLISFSSEQANAKLRTLRLAYGLGGSDESIKPADVHALFNDFISGDKRLSQDWDPYADLGVVPKKGFAKMLILSLLLVSDGLPKGGVISIESDGENTTLVKGEGENAHFREGYLHALAHSIETNNLSPNLTHPYITGLIAQNYGFEITVDETENNFILLRLKSSDVC